MLPFAPDLSADQCTALAGAAAVCGLAMLWWLGRYLTGEGA